MERTQNNFQMVRSLFNTELERIGYSGVIGVAGFKNVYHELMPVQRNKLKEVCNGHFQSFMDEGSIICLGVAYPEYAIDCIDVKLACARALMTEQSIEIDGIFMQRNIISLTES